MSPARVVITGIGAISPLGLTTKDMWQGLCEGKCGIDRIKAFDPAGFDCQIAGEAPDFKIRDFVPKSQRKTTKLMSRDITLAIVAAHEAFLDSKLVTKGIDAENINVDPARMAINLGAGVISCDLVELSPAIAKSVTDGKFDIRKWGSEGLDFVTPLWLLKYLPNMLACHIGIIHDIQGPSNSITCAEAASHLAIIEAAQIIERGDADIALAGGGEAKVNPLIHLRQCLLKRATTQANDNPNEACRPFDAKATGAVFGEAAAMVVLENLVNAQKRQAKIYAEIIGFGQSNNLNPAYEKLEPEAKGTQIAVEKAIEQAGISQDELDLIIPHGTGVAEDDKAEAAAIQNALGKAASTIPVFPTKSMLGNTGAAAGAVDVITAVCAMNEGKIPAAKNCENKADGCDLNITAAELQKDIRYALCCSYTYGGQTAAIILKKFDGE